MVFMYRSDMAGMTLLGTWQVELVKIFNIPYPLSAISIVNFLMLSLSTLTDRKTAKEYAA